MRPIDDTLILPRGLRDTVTALAGQAGSRLKITGARYRDAYGLGVLTVTPGRQAGITRHDRVRRQP